jgi:hypothetical protein
MIPVPDLTDPTAYFFPEDKVAGKEAFLDQWTHPVETWMRAYALTQRELVEVLIPAALLAPQHIYVDRSQTLDANQLVLVKELAAAPGIDITVGTSPEGESFISHAKSTARIDGLCWMGSWNFSESASSQVNHAIQFQSPTWRDALIAQFNLDCGWAWAHESAYQVQTHQPQPRTA